jgi:transposase InsO family protein
VKFVQAHRAEFGVEPLCRVVNLPVSTFYDRKARPPSAWSTADAQLAERIEKIWVGSGRTYGAPRVHAQLARDGIRVGRKRVERIMARHGWRGAYLRRGWQTTTRRGPAEAAVTVPDLVQRKFTADHPNAVWVADITYVRTLQGFFYLAMVLDVFSRRLVGWMMGDSLATQLVLDAVEMAIHRRDTAPHPRSADDHGLIHHSDRGAQYTSFGFSQRLVEAGIAPSLGSVGDSFDNAMAESWFGTIKIELIYRRVWPSRHDAEPGIFAWIEGWYNPRRIQRALGWRSPNEYEAGFYAAADLSVPATAQPAPVLGGVKHTTLDTASGPAHGRSGGNDQENRHPKEPPMIDESQ